MSEPAGNDMQMLPPTVAAFQTLNDARSDSQHILNRGAAFHSGGALKRVSSASVQVAAISRPSAEACSAGQPSDWRSISVSVRICGVENSHVPPASQAYPSRHSPIWPADEGRSIAVMVFKFKSRASSRTALEDQPNVSAGAQSPPNARDCDPPPEATLPICSALSMVASLEGLKTLYLRTCTALVFGGAAHEQIAADLRAARGHAHACCLAERLEARVSVKSTPRLCARKLLKYIFGPPCSLEPLE